MDVPGCLCCPKPDDKSEYTEEDEEEEDGHKDGFYDDEDGASDYAWGEWPEGTYLTDVLASAAKVGACPTPL